MGIEIERKFRVLGDGWRALATRRDHLIQGYLVDMSAIDVGVAHCTVRVRADGHQGWLTIKSADPGLTRQEFEYPIPLADAKAILGNLTTDCLEKYRHHVYVGDTHFEVDEFLGQSAGLVIAEVELDQEEAPFALPDWLGQEVSHETRFYNVSLARHPYQAWPAAQR